MATASALISKLDSIFHNPIYRPSLILELRICLRNLNVHLVCLRNVADDETHVIKSLVSRIDVAIQRIPIYNSRFHAENMNSENAFVRGLVDSLREVDCHPEEVFEEILFVRALVDSLREVNCLAKEVKDEWYTSTMPICLTLDDVLHIADSIVHSMADFWIVVEVCSNNIPNPASLRDVMDEFEVQTRFLRDFMLFAKRSVIQNQKLQNLLIYVSSFVMDAACSFMIDGILSIHNVNWVYELKLKCPRMDPQVFQAYTQTLLCISTILDHQTKDAVLKDFLSSLISLLWHVLRYHRHHLRHSDSLKALYECLRLSRLILKQQLMNNNDDFEDQIGVLIRDAGILICSLYLTGVDSPSLSDLLQRFGVLQANLPPESNSLKDKALDVGDCTSMEENFDGKVQIDIANHQNSITSEVVGFQDDELILVLDRLTRGSKQLRLVPISGMAGLGKTTFALKVYNDLSVLYGFQARAWCTVSQVFQKKRVLLKLLKQIQPGDYSRISEDDLANKLHQSLKQKKYLILLDDVWTPQVLESLRPSFPDDPTQSRILLTSRLHAIFPHALPDEQPHFLRLRKENECFEIIQSKLLHKVGYSMGLKKFAKLCKGLPLTAVLVAGLLSTTMEEGWEGILDQLSSGGISQMEQCKIALEFSYKNLPEDLKLCFMYFGAFPEDEEIYTKKFLRLWMAEGFVAKEQDMLEKRVEDIAREYLDNLIQRNLIMVDKKRSTGGVKTCRIHDLLHGFCLMKGKQENLFNLLLQRNDELSDFNEPYNMERLSIHSGALHFKESRLFCPQAHSVSLFTTTGNTEDVRLSDMLFIIQTFKLLKVLNIDQIWCVTGIPSEIALLTRLTYLSIGCGMTVIPSSIGNLSNLQTLIIRFLDTKAVSLPQTIWDLHKLKYLYITKYCPGFSLLVENMESSPSLLELEAIHGVIFYSDESMKKQMSKFPNIRRLKCNIQQRGKTLEELNKILVFPEFLNQLESLTLCTKNTLHYKFDFGCAESLKKVTLERFVLSREEIAVIGKLPNLEVLKLIEISFLGGKMEMEEGEFSKLRILEFRGSFMPINLEMWTATEDEQLPYLKKLVFDNCLKLNEIPYYCLETSLTLEEIELSDCSPALESLVRDIEKVQKDYGNLIKVQIRMIRRKKSG